MLKEHNFFTERRLRQIAVIKDNYEQVRNFSQLVNDMQFELNGEID